MGVVGGYWGQWMLARAGISAPASYCPGLPGGLVSSQGAKGSSGAKGEKVPWGMLWVARWPWHPCAHPRGEVPHCLCHLAGITGCRCTGTTRTGWASRFEGNPCPHVTLALIMSLIPH